MPKVTSRATKTHIYRVSLNGEEKLVRATSRAKATRYVIGSSVVTSIATQDELVDMLGRGIEVEEIEA